MTVSLVMRELSQLLKGRADFSPFCNNGLLGVWGCKSVRCVPPEHTKLSPIPRTHGEMSCIVISELGSNERRAPGTGWSTRLD